MFDLIRQMFAGPKLSDESRDFVTKLATSRIWILAVGIRGKPALPRDTNPESLKIIAAHRIDVSQLGSDDSVFPFNFHDGGKQVLPFFSSEELAKAFASEGVCSMDISRVFQPRRLRSGFVAAPQNDDCELVLDPRSPAERTLCRGERLLLRSLSKVSRAG